MAPELTAPVLDAWFASLGGAAMEAQLHLLRGHLESLTAYAETDAALRRIDPSMAALIAPPRLLLQEMTADLEVDLRIDRSDGFEIAVQHVGIGYQRRFSTSSETSTRLAFTVRPSVTADSLSSSPPR